MSLYIDGEPYASISPKGIDVQAAMNMERTRIDLIGYCEHALHGMSSVQVRISMNLDETDMLIANHKYEITQYTEAPDDTLSEEEIPSEETPSEEDDTQQDTPEEAYARIRINGVYADSGWIQFHYLTSNIAAGSFECTYTDDEGVQHLIDYGNFDIRVGNYPLYLKWE